MGNPPSKYVNDLLVFHRWKVFWSCSSNDRKETSRSSVDRRPVGLLLLVFFTFLKYYPTHICTGLISNMRVNWAVYLVTSAIVCCCFCSIILLMFSLFTTKIKLSNFQRCYFPTKEVLRSSCGSCIFFLHLEFAPKACGSNFLNYLSSASISSSPFLTMTVCLDFCFALSLWRSVFACLPLLYRCGGGCCGGGVGVLATKLLANNIIFNVHRSILVPVCVCGGVIFRFRRIYFCRFVDGCVFLLLWLEGIFVELLLVLATCRTNIFLANLYVDNFDPPTFSDGYFRYSRIFLGFCCGLFVLIYPKQEDPAKEEKKSSAKYSWT